MEVAPRYTLLTLLTMLAWFTLIPKHPNRMRMFLNIPTENIWKNTVIDDRAMKW